MSHTQSSALATCTVANLGTVEEAATAVVDYLSNHEDEIPEYLQDVSHEEAVEILADYLQVAGNHLTISYKSEGVGNTSNEVFEFLSSHYACLQSSLYMTVHWCVLDSRTGMDAGTSYWDRSNSMIDVDAALTAYLASP